MQLTKDFTLEEFTRSETATAKKLKNAPTKEQIHAIEYLTEAILQPARSALGKITITSGFRSKEVNKETPGASKTSQHCEGEAADLECGNNARLFHWIAEYCLFDQLIWESGDEQQPAWVHVSAVNGKNRGEKLRSVKEKGKTVYINF